MKETKLKRKLRIWKERHYSSIGYLYIDYRKHPYVKGTVGADIKLTLWQRIQILFCGGVTVTFHGKNMSK